MFDLIFAVVFFGGGIILIAVGLGFLFQVKINKSWIRVNGVIVDTNFDYRGFTTGNAPTKYPIVEYEVGGVKYRVSDRIYTLPWPKTGETRTLRYDPFNPSSAKLEPAFPTVAMAFVFPPLGLLFILVAILLTLVILD